VNLIKHSRIALPILLTSALLTFGAGMRHTPPTHADTLPTATSTPTPVLPLGPGRPIEPGD
jgi:hypothetical protein